MRRQYFYWTFLVTAVVLSIYGTYSLVYSIGNNKDIPVLGLIFFIIGILMLIGYFVLFVIDMHNKKKNPVVNKTVEVEKVEEPKIEAKNEEIAAKPAQKEENSIQIEDENDSYKERIAYSRSSRDDDFDGGSVYVSLVGYGPVLRVEGRQILDMRNNTYYRIEGNMVDRNGYGPVFEIVGNKVKVAFGSYLYELSGDSVNKVFGGFYASFSGNYLQTHDNKEKYEITGSLNRQQKLAVVALLLGTY